ncbi:MAG: LON peptidase substrate-binding domain-containing protein [Hyphomicrobiaceae bacterium]
MFTDKYRSPSDLPSQLPVFPLKGALLLPRATLPLNIFEPRYLAMIDDVISGDRILGMVQPGGGSGEESPLGKSSDVRSVGCAGRLSAYQELDDGRVLISLTGLCRYRIVEEVTRVTPYRSFVVDYKPYENDLIAGFGEDEVDRDKLHRVLKSYLETNRLSADWRAIANASTELLINALSVISPFGSEEKQALLEAPTLKDRANVLIALTEMELASGDGGSGGGMIQ